MWYSKHSFSIIFAFFFLHVHSQTNLERPAAEIGIQEIETGSSDHSNASFESHGGGHCRGDTVLYEDFSNGFAGANGKGISWDTSGTYEAWRECGSVCPTNGPYTDISSEFSSPTQSNGVINLDVQWKAGYIYGPGGPTPNGPPPEQYMTMNDVVDLSALKTPVVTLHTAFYHCCALDHEILLQVDTNMSGKWDDSFDLSANVDRNELGQGKYVYHIGPAIQGNADSVRIRFTWPPTGPDANDQVSGVYNWYIDDVVIRDANRNDLSADNSTYISGNSGLFDSSNVAIEHTQIPKCHMDNFRFGAQVCNVGRNSLDSVRLQATVFDAAGQQVFQTTSKSYSLDSISCIGGNLSGYQPPVPDSIWGQNGYVRKDTGTYRVEYKAITDTVDCDTTNNFAPLEEFKVTCNTFAIDDYDRTGNITRTIVSPSSGGGYGEANVYNSIEFTCGASNKDTVKQVSVWIADTTQAGAGPFKVGIGNLSGTVYRESQSFYVTSSDIGGWVTKDLVLDSNGNNVGGLPVPVGTNDLKTIFVKYPGGAERVGYGMSGNAQDFHTWIEGNFGGGGSALYTTGDLGMLRAHTSGTPTIRRLACDSFTVPSGDETYYSSGVYQDTLKGFIDCDSIFNIDLTIGDTSSSQISPIACKSYTVPSGDETYTSSGVYEDTIPNIYGCDSLITIDLSIKDTSSASISRSLCYSYTVPSGDETYTSSGVYEDTIPNSFGCDSLITIDLTIKDSSSSSIAPAVCDSFTVPSGDETYTSSGTYEDTIVNSAGCDSLITIDLTINSVDTSVTSISATELEAADSGATYQWLDCDSGYAPISGETSQQFTASSNGNYAVEVSKNGCVDTSDCHAITEVGIAENSLDDNLSFYPNPTDRKITVEAPGLKGPIQVTLRDLNGKLIRNEEIQDPQRFQLELGEESGVYLLRLKKADGQEALIRVVKE